MKLIRRYTARGKLSENDSEAGNPAKIELFDGRFDTGYKVVKFYVFAASSGGSTTGDVIGKVCTSPNCETGPGDFFNSNDPREIAWAWSEVGTDSGGGGLDQIIDEENFAVEDLYVYARGQQDTAGVNYLVVLEKYEISDWEGALAMAKDRQGDEDGI